MSSKKRSAEISPAEKLELLSKSKGWTVREFRKYFSIGQVKAYELLTKAEKVKYFDGYYTIESILALFGLNKVEETKLVLMQLGYFDKIDSYNIANTREE